MINAIATNVIKLSLWPCAFGERPENAMRQIKAIVDTDHAAPRRVYPASDLAGISGVPDFLIPIAAKMISWSSAPNQLFRRKLDTKHLAQAVNVHVYQHSSRRH